jgi:hypothetical protein
VRALADQIALELSKRAKDMEHELPGRRSRSICSVSRANPTPCAFQLVGPVNEVAEAGAQAVQAPDDQRIALA